MHRSPKSTLLSLRRTATSTLSTRRLTSTTTLCSATTILIALAKATESMDASLAEINPFILTKDGNVYALDAKINLDDNALFRHKDLLELRDLNEEDPLEVEASKHGLNYRSEEHTS